MDKINVTKIAPFFLQTPTHHSFTFNSQSLYEMKHKVHLSKNSVQDFLFSFLSHFYVSYIFVQQNAWTPWL